MTEFNLGDIVKVTSEVWGPDAFIQGPLTEAFGDWFVLGTSVYRNSGTRPVNDLAVELIKAAPKPFYKNHGREAPVDGDVASYADWKRPYFRIRNEWVDSRNNRLTTFNNNFTLILDGETGKPV